MKSVSMCFSPTGGGEKIAQAIRRGMDGNLDEGMEPYLFVIPVYGGHMPVPARECFEKVCVTDNRPAILVAVYGNRAFERALVDLEDFVCERGFCPIAAAAFVCEHSYSTADTPIAAGRPDEADLQAAEDFGRRVREKLLAGSLSPIHAADLQDEPSPEASVKKFVAFVQSFRTRQAVAPQKPVPSLDKDLCSGCGICVSACPVGAIQEDLSVDAARCINCCACVKACPAGARSFRTPFARPLSECFSVRKSPRWLL